MEGSLQIVDVNKFEALAVHERLAALQAAGNEDRKLLIRVLAPDDAADVLQKATREFREQLLLLLDQATRAEVIALLAYAEDVAGGLMTPRFLRLRPELTIKEAKVYVERQIGAGQASTSRYIYVLAVDQKLLGVLSARELQLGASTARVEEIMRRDVITVHDHLDREAVAHVYNSHAYKALPVIDADGRMVGVLTADDIVGVVQAEATEDMHKVGGSPALDAPYLQAPLRAIIPWRAIALAILFVGETFTASALGYFQDEIAKHVALTLFMPLILSSGGNSGSQATTFVIRALALGQIKLRDAFKVFRREFIIGASLGAILAVLGLLRVLGWQFLFNMYGDLYMTYALIVLVSLIGVVLWGSLVGALLPLIIKACRCDPATSSAPLVATFVDVTGLIIYFEVAKVLLAGL